MLAVVTVLEVVTAYEKLMIKEPILPFLREHQILAVAFRQKISQFANPHQYENTAQRK